MAWLTLGVFAAVLLICIATGGPLLLALAVGLVLFLLYGRRAGFSWRELGRMCLDGIKTVRNILITFVLIGILTAFWRASGTIPAIVCYASSLIRPSILLLMTFLLNCLVSVLTGTAFGTGATMGVICATMAASLGLDVRLVGGAILAGVYFGDRCSPVSTSALLVAELTRTSIYSNIHRMVRTAVVPFLSSCVIYLVLGFTQNAGGDLPDLRTLFARVFVLHWAALAPAVVILVLSVLQINVKIAMSASIFTALPLCMFLQHVPVPDLLKMVFTGYQTADAQVGVMMNGGGIFSMVRVAGIVCLSSAYSGIFQKTGLLDGLKRGIETVSRKTNVFAATFLTGTAASMLACNQSLGILLTNQLCRDLEQDRDRFANILEDTVVVVAPLVPWSIAGGVPLASAGAPTSSIPFAVYLWLLPLWGLLRSFLRNNLHRAGSENSQNPQERRAVG